MLRTPHDSAAPGPQIVTWGEWGISVEEEHSNVEEGHSNARAGRMEVGCSLGAPLSSGGGQVDRPGTPGCEASGRQSLAQGACLGFVGTEQMDAERTDHFLWKGEREDQHTQHCMHLMYLSQGVLWVGVVSAHHTGSVADLVCQGAGHWGTQAVPEGPMRG